MDDEIVNPEKELEKVRSALKKYDVLLKTSRNEIQRSRIKQKIEELQAYEAKILYLFESRRQDDPEKRGFFSGDSFLDMIQERDKKVYSSDGEIDDICHYFYFFNTEFLSIFSERKMHLDFKFSLERDNFHHRFQDQSRRLEDFLSEHSRLKEGRYVKGMEMELRRRHMQVKRNLFLDIDRLFKRVDQFALGLIEDLNGGELICLNGDDIIHFELSDRKKFLEGLTVKDAVYKIHDFVKEVLDYLNIPDIESGRSG